MALMHLHTHTHTHTHTQAFLKGPVLHQLRTRFAGWTTMHLLLQLSVQTNEKLNVLSRGYLGLSLHALRKNSIKA